MYRGNLRQTIELRGGGRPPPRAPSVWARRRRPISEGSWRAGTRFPHALYVGEAGLPTRPLRLGAASAANQSRSWRGERGSPARPLIRGARGHPGHVARAMITCPKTGPDAPPAADMDRDQFEAFSLEVGQELDCPACGERHVWTKDDAHLERPDEPHGGVTEEAGPPR